MQMTLPSITITSAKSVNSLKVVNLHLILNSDFAVRGKYFTKFAESKRPNHLKVTQTTRWQQITINRQATDCTGFTSCGC